MHQLNTREHVPLIALARLLLATLIAGMPGISFAGEALHARTNVTVQNPLGLKFPEQRMQIVHNIICRVVAKELRVDERKANCALNLVLGDKKERVTADEEKGVYTVYLERWDETNFAISDMRLAVQQMVSSDRWERMEREIVRSVKEVAPVNAREGATRSKHPQPETVFRP